MPRCPDCDGAMTRIAYGMPAPPLREAAERGEVILGGCVAGDFSPKWGCIPCGTLRAEKEKQKIMEQVIDRLRKSRAEAEGGGAGILD
ncbi:hypothetical protein FNL39_101313 [Nocardia caishijiensis]|uniref:Uncharacterized protein n=2 Tax=Nocardia caishijiensis TaxID=184756 RepID=A0ABQ6YSU2_9NOCA|nr:hypothetical protein FNL39_101313 [Nocardia caishijiensis]